MLCAYCTVIGELLVILRMSRDALCCVLYVQEEGILALVLEARNTIHNQIFITVSDQY